MKFVIYRTNQEKYDPKNWGYVELDTMEDLQKLIVDKDCEVIISPPMNQYSKDNVYEQWRIEIYDNYRE